MIAAALKPEDPLRSTTPMIKSGIIEHSLSRILTTKEGKAVVSAIAFENALRMVVTIESEISERTAGLDGLLKTLWAEKITPSRSRSQDIFQMTMNHDSLLCLSQGNEVDRSDINR